MQTTFSTNQPKSTDHVVIGHYIESTFQYKVKVVSYKIFVAKDTPKARHPRNWIIWGSKLNADDGTYETVKLDQVRNAGFDTVYKGKIADPGEGYDKIALEIKDDNSPEDAPKVDVTIAEVRYFGPKSQFSKHINGGLSCPRVPQYPVGKWLKDGTPFSSDSLFAQSHLRQVFDNDSLTPRHIRAMLFPEADEDPLIIGIVFASPIEVLQFGIRASDGHLYDSPKRTNFVGRRVVLEGHKCDPTCDKLGEDGWEVLAKGDGSKSYAKKWMVKFPGVYKGYRVKIFRTSDEYGLRGTELGGPNTADLDMSEVYLMVCR